MVGHVVRQIREPRSDGHRAASQAVRPAGSETAATRTANATTSVHDSKFCGSKNAKCAVHKAARIAAWERT
jgi:hypothetical protein